MMQRKDWVFELEKDMKKLENRFDKLFTRWQKHLHKKKRATNKET